MQEYHLTLPQRINETRMFFVDGATDKKPFCSYKENATGYPACFVSEIHSEVKVYFICLSVFCRRSLNAPSVSSRHVQIEMRFWQDRTVSIKYY